jgi:hypothetical protein
MDEGTGTTLTDSEGSNDLTTNADWLHGDYDMNGDQQTKDGLYFNLTDAVELSGASLLKVGTGNFTVELWVDLDNLQATSYLISKNLISEIAVYSLTSKSCRAFLDGVELDRLSATGTGLQQIVFRRSGTDCELIINGTPSGSPGVSAFDMTGATPVTLGARSSDKTNGLTGHMKVCRIWHRALSNLEITALYNRGANG